MRLRDFLEWKLENCFAVSQIPSQLVTLGKIILNLVHADLSISVLGYRFKFLAALSEARRSYYFEILFKLPWRLFVENVIEVLLLAYKLGYFDVPKKINSDELATRLRLTGSTVVEHLNKAEHRLLRSIIIEN